MRSWVSSKYTVRWSSHAEDSATHPLCSVSISTGICCFLTRCICRPHWRTLTLWHCHPVCQCILPFVSFRYCWRWYSCIYQKSLHRCWTSSGCFGCSCPMESGELQLNWNERTSWKRLATLVYAMLKLWFRLYILLANSCNQSGAVCCHIALLAICDEMYLLNNGLPFV